MVRRPKSKHPSKTSPLMVRPDLTSKTISLTPTEQLAFWQALQQMRPLTAKQRQLGRLMRAEE